LIKPILLLSAWRNVRRNRRRTLLGASAIALGLATLLFLGSFSDGVHRSLVRSFQDTIVGSLQIHRAGFFRHPSLERHIADLETVAGALRKGGVDRWTHRIETYALASGPAGSLGVMVMGLEPVAEGAVTRLPEKASAGRFFGPGDDRAVVLGAGTARDLGVGVGDRFTVLMHERFGLPVAEELTVVGLITSGETGIDRGLLLVPLAMVQRLLEMEGRVTSIVARVAPERLEAVTATLRVALDDHSLEVMRWYDMFPVLREWLGLDQGFHYLLSGIVLVIVLVAVLNTTLLSVLERSRELGSLMALGAKPWEVGLMLMLEAILVGALGTALGSALGAAAVGVAHAGGIDLSRLLGATAQLYLDPVVRPVLTAPHLAWMIAAVVAAAVLAGVYPALRAGRMEPVEVLRGD
jgi:ABC-type lipoprotein release transport system permease subunit